MWGWVAKKKKKIIIIIIIIERGFPQLPIDECHVNVVGREFQIGINLGKKRIFEIVSTLKFY